MDEWLVGRDGPKMEILEIVGICGLIIPILLFFGGLFWKIYDGLDKKLTAVNTELSEIKEDAAKSQTNINLLLQWVACLNGEMSNEKEFKEFLKKLKAVNKKNCMDSFCD